MRTLWVTGANGTVGSRLVNDAVQQGNFDRIYAFRHSPLLATEPDPQSSVTWGVLDISDQQAVESAAITAPPTVIINPAAMTNVDACETRRDEAQRANVIGPQNLAQISRTYNAQLLHISTDYVFPGNESYPGPYDEDDSPQPINYYGQTKLDGDTAVINICANSVPYTVIRTALVVGTGHRTNFVNWVGKELLSGKRIRIVRDQYNTPTLADDLSLALLWLAEHDRTGVYHVAGPDRLGRHEWAIAIAQHFNLDVSLIDWVSTAELGQAARRPLQSGLNCTRYGADIQQGAPYLRGIDESLRSINWLAGLQKV